MYPKLQGYFSQTHVSGSARKGFAVTAIAFCVGTGGLMDAEYFQKKQDRGYDPFQFKLTPLVRSIAPRTAVTDLNRVREIFKPAMSELASLFNVSRQAIYNWQGGATPSQEHQAILEDVAKAADVLLSGGVENAAQIWKRKVLKGKTFAEIVRDGGSAHESALAFIQTIKRENEQRKALDARLAGRRPVPDYLDYGMPKLDESV